MFQIESGDDSSSIKEYEEPIIVEPMNRSTTSLSQFRKEYKPLNL